MVGSSSVGVSSGPGNKEGGAAGASVPGFGSCKYCTQPRATRPAKMALDSTKTHISAELPEFKGGSEAGA
jgi:hypothetical protein